MWLYRVEKQRILVCLLVRSRVKIYTNQNEIDEEEDGDFEISIQQENAEKGDWNVSCLISFKISHFWNGLKKSADREARETLVGPKWLHYCSG